MQDGWTAFGEIRRAYGSEFAEWTTSLKGPKGRGRLHGVANRVGASWQLSRLLYVSEDGKTELDITPTPKRDAFVFAEGNQKVFLVPLDSRQVESLTWAPAYYKAKFGLEAVVLPALPLDGSVWNANRHQLIATNRGHRREQRRGQKCRSTSRNRGVSISYSLLGNLAHKYAPGNKMSGPATKPSTTWDAQIPTAVSEILLRDKSASASRPAGVTKRNSRAE